MLKWLKHKINKGRVIQELGQEIHYYRNQIERIFDGLCDRGIYYDGKVTERHIKKAQETLPLSGTDRNIFAKDADIQNLLKQLADLRACYFALCDVQFQA